MKAPCPATIFAICLTLMGCGEKTRKPMCEGEWGKEISALMVIAADESTGILERLDAIDKLGKRGKKFYTPYRMPVYGCWQLNLASLESLFSNPSPTIVRASALAAARNVSRNKMLNVLEGCTVAKTLRALDSLLGHSDPTVRQEAINGIRLIYQTHGDYGWFGFILACNCRGEAKASLKRAREDANINVRGLASAPLHATPRKWKNW